MKLDHCLIDGHIPLGLVELHTLAVDGVEEGPDLPQPIASGCSWWWEGLVIHEMEIPSDIPEAITSYPRGDGVIVEIWILPPIIVNRWQLDDPHEDTKSEVGSELFHCHICPLLMLTLFHRLLCIQVSLIHNVVHHHIGEEQVKDVSRLC